MSVNRGIRGLSGRILLSVILAGALLAPAYAQVAINEVRIDQTSTDNDEYMELAGGSGTALDGLTYLVIGDGSGGSGVIEAVVDLTGFAIPTGGFFVAAESTFTAGTADMVTSLNFENSDNVTHMVVSGFSGADGDDLDTDDDGVLDVTPWTAIVDCVALIETVGSGDLVYCSETVGPDGSYVPGHAYRCPDQSGSWVIGSFDLGVDDTPGAANACVVPTGACCDETSGDCTEDVTEASCTGAGNRYGGDDSTCATIDPPCVGIATGACCVAHACIDDLTEADCTPQGGVFQGGGSTCASTTCPTPPSVIISEIMYNPNSNEGSSPDYINLVEWVEIYNNGDTTVDITGWGLMDEDPSGDWLAAGPIPAATIAAGEAVVLIPGPDTQGGASPGLSVADFQAAWGAGYQVVPIDNWGDNLYSLSNSPDLTSEIVTLTDASGVAVDVANYDDSYPTDNGWPNPFPGGPSIYVKCFALDGAQNDLGTSWDLSTDGVDGAFIVTPTAVFDGVDVGSPGFVFECSGLVGACCDWATYTCTDDVAAVDCQGDDQEWTASTLCSELDPPCLPPVYTGACCFAGFCADDLEQADCEAGGGVYQGDDSLCSGVTCPAGPAVVINEVRIDQSSADDDEYFELAGDAGASLDGLTYLVIGDGDGDSGTVEAVIPLTGSAIPGSGFFVAAESTFTLGTADLVTNINFENSDNVTHLLVAGFSGADGDDLDTDDDCVLDVMPWAGEYDRVALVETDNPPVDTECHYGPAQVGPDGTYVPGHAYRCADLSGTWRLGGFTLGEDDTPGAANACGACCADGACSEGSCGECAGAFQGTGSVCTTEQACCLPDGTCTMADVLCCENELGGTPQGDGSECGGMEACCLGDGTCTMADALCCVNELGGTPQGPSSICEGDTDSDGLDGACGDECPLDADKYVPGLCGCGTPDVDTDGDGVPDCNDLCPGVDDDAFGPGCADAIPTVSQWGLVVLALLLLTVSKVRFAGRSTTAA